MSTSFWSTCWSELAPPLLSWLTVVFDSLSALAGPVPISALLVPLFDESDWLSAVPPVLPACASSASSAEMLPSEADASASCPSGCRPRRPTAPGL